MREEFVGNPRVSIRWCPGCKPHKFQDEKHGKNKRVHNATGRAGGRIEGWRCTVCENVKNA